MRQLVAVLSNYCHSMPAVPWPSARAPMLYAAEDVNLKLWPHMRSKSRNATHSYAEHHKMTEEVIRMRTVRENGVDVERRVRFLYPSPFYLCNNTLSPLYLCNNMRRYESTAEKKENHGLWWKGGNGQSLVRLLAAPPGLSQGLLLLGEKLHSCL
jgi:hypothetical protein